MGEFITNHIVSIFIAFLGAGAWLFERRQRIANAKVTEGDAVARMQTAYDKFIKDADDKFEKLKKEIEEVKKELEECKKLKLDAA